MDTYKIHAFIILFVVYIVLFIPQLLIIFNKKNYSNLQTISHSLLLSVVLGTILTCLLYAFPNKIISIFSQKNGTIHFAIYASKPLFITNALAGVFPIFLGHLLFQKKYKKLLYFIALKCFLFLLFILIGYLLFSLKGALFAVPICNLIFIIIGLFIILK